MDALEIAYRLRLLGKSQTDIAKELGISPQVVHRVIGGQITAHAVATYIAYLLGSTPKRFGRGATYLSLEHPSLKPETLCRRIA